MKAYVVKVPFITELFERDPSQVAHPKYYQERFARKVAALDRPYAITVDADAELLGYRVICYLEWLGGYAENEQPIGMLMEYVATIEKKSPMHLQNTLESYLDENGL